MKVFVTGATGLIGKSTVRALVAGGHEVTGLTSRPAGRAAVEALGAKALVGDMADAAAYRDVVRASDAVVHAAAALPDKMRLSEADVDAFMGLDVRAVDALVSVLGDRCRAFVVSSGAYVYGDTGTAPVSEGFGTAAHHRMMALKVAMETRLCAMKSVPVMIARPGSVYGDGSLWRQLYLGKMVQKKRAMIPGGDQVLSFVHEADVGTAYRALVERPAPGEAFNVADDLPERLETVVRLQAAEFGAPAPWRIPRWVLRLVAGDVVATPTLANMSLSNAKLKAQGWTPKYPTYREGIPALARSLRAT